MPEGAHPLGWGSEPVVEPDGENWSLEFAAKMLDMPEKDLRDLVRILGLPSAGVIRMAEFRRQGRHPRAYPADKLALIAETVRDLSEDLAA